MWGGEAGEGLPDSQKELTVGVGQLFIVAGGRIMTGSGAGPKPGPQGLVSFGGLLVVSWSNGMDCSGAFFLGHRQRTCYLFQPVEISSYPD